MFVRVRNWIEVQVELRQCYQLQVRPEQEHNADLLAQIQQLELELEVALNQRKAQPDYSRDPLFNGY